MPHVTCPGCGRSKAVTAEVFASLVGKSIRCTQCHAESVVEERGPFDFLDAPPAPMWPAKITPALTKEQREAVAEQNVSDYKASKSPTIKSAFAWGCDALSSLCFAMEGVFTVASWLCVALAVVAVSFYSGLQSGDGIGVLVFVASLIVILLTQVIDLLKRIVGLLDRD